MRRRRCGETAIAARWEGPAVWFHGDVSAGNLLLRGGEPAGVIDFGCAGVGDPAGDLTIAWTLLSGESRAVFRSALAADAASWARGRGRALWKALISLAERVDSDPAAAANAQGVIGAVIADHELPA